MIPSAVVKRMYADYKAGASLSEVGRRYGRSASTVRELFQSRGLYRRPDGRPRPCNIGPDGRFLPAPKLTVEEIMRLANEATRIVVPTALKLEWRTWPLPLRAAFIAHVRARLKLPSDRPDGPFSANVIPFDYGTPRAHELSRKRGALLTGGHVKPSSQGVIWKGKLYFWTEKAGYTIGIEWTPEHGRPQLHHLIWEEAHGCKVPPACVVRFIDGNRNNHDPKNLVLATRNDLARENQARGLSRKSREITALLLQRSQKPKEQSHDLIQALRS